MSFWYATREDVKSALDAKETARNNDAVDRALAAATPAVEGLLHRSFYPWTGTREFTFPQPGSAVSSKLWLDQNEVISLTSLVVAGDTVGPSEYSLEPTRYGPPYNSINLINEAYSYSSSPERAVAGTGVFGYRIDETPQGTLTAGVNSSATSITITADAKVGVGSLIRIDDERMVVTDRSWTDTTQVTSNSMDAKVSTVTVGVSNGSDFLAGETILVDAEKMLVVDVAGNNLVVKRAWDGSVLAAHTVAAVVYASRTLRVSRGVLGTTAASHSTAAQVHLFLYPALVRELAIAFAITYLQQEGAGWARTAGGGENEREVSGRGLNQIKQDAYAAHGRKARIRSA
jgi:hypothetical protein